MSNYSVDDYINVYKKCDAYTFSPEMVCNNDRSIIMGSLDISVTTKCTMRCKGCASLTSLYKKGEDQDILTIINSIDKIVKNVNTIIRVNILGGEPFLFQQLDELCEYLNTVENIKRVVIMTNGTIVQKNKRLLNALSNDKYEIRISEYVKNEALRAKLIQTLSSSNIKYSIKYFSNGHFHWFDFGTLDFRNRALDELRNQYNQCSVQAQYLHNGKLYVCPRAAHGIELGSIPDDNDCCIDLNDELVDDAQLKDKINEMIFRTKIYNCCNYCNRGTDMVKEIPVAEQI